METWPRPGGSIEGLLRDKVQINATNLSAREELLTIEHVEYFAMMAIASQLERPDGPYREIVAFGTATYILASFLGREWTNDHAFAVHTEVDRKNKEGRAFFKAESADGSFDQFLLMNRVESLAELLLNYQAVPGMEYRVSILQSDNLESALGELECFRLISSPEFNARFIVPTGQKGSDYDCEFETESGEVVCCEIKTKQESLDYTASTVLNTLDHARRQLPKERPGMVFLRIPERLAKAT